MRRKSSRSTSKSSPEKSKIDSPKRSRKQSSRRRKRSSSKSSYDSEDDIQTDIKESTQNNASVNPISEKNSADGSKDYGELGDQARGRKHDRSKPNAGSETPERKPSGYDRPYSPSHSPLDKDDNDDSQDKDEEKEEKKNKGKSKGKNKSNIEQSSNNIEPETENENVQGTPQSPSNDNADNENVQNVNDTIRSNLEEQEQTGTENEVTDNENVRQKTTESEINFESEYVQQSTNQSVGNPEKEKNQENEPAQENKNSTVENPDNITENKLKISKESSYERQKSNSRRRSSSEKEERSSSKRYSSKRSSKEDRSTTPEPRIKEESNSRNQIRENLEGPKVEDCDTSRRKSCDENTKEKIEDGENSSKKKIILRRSAPENKEGEKTEQKSTRKERKTSADESKKETEAREPKAGKKFTLRRPTIDERCSVDEKIDRKPEDLNSENLSDKKERLSSLCEDKSQDVEEKPQRQVKRIKLIRNFSREPKQDSEENKSLTTLRKRKWSTSDWLNKLTSSLCKIDVDTIKIVCPSLQFLSENEVHLETIPKERKVSERKVSVDNRSEDSDRPEYEKQTSEESSGEVKIELNPNIIAMNRKISIVDDTASKLRPPPSPAKHPTSDVLFITNLVRPFTVKQLKELLERTGKIKEDGFWTDRIKSKCYVRYESVEEAEATRNALHGVHWPIGNGKKLVIDYAKVEDLEKAKNPAPVTITIPDKIPEKENREPERAEEKYKDREDRDRKKRDGVVREWDLGKEDSRRGRTRTRSRSRERARKHSRRSYTPEDYISKKQRKAEESVPQKLMDDLFLKTKATPSIYWQPLSPEEIATKQMQRLVRMEEHKRRIEETRGRVRDSRRGPFRRR